MNMQKPFRGPLMKEILIGGWFSAKAKPYVFDSSIVTRNKHDRKKKQLVVGRMNC